MADCNHGDAQDLGIFEQDIPSSTVRHVRVLGLATLGSTHRSLGRQQEPSRRIGRRAGERPGEWVDTGTSAPGCHFIPRRSRGRWTPSAIQQPRSSNRASLLGLLRMLGLETWWQPAADAPDFSLAVGWSSTCPIFTGPARNPPALAKTRWGYGVAQRAQDGSDASRVFWNSSFWNLSLLQPPPGPAQPYAYFGLGCIQRCLHTRF
jgi:hypothetical protein